MHGNMYGSNGNFLPKMYLLLRLLSRHLIGIYCIVSNLNPAALFEFCFLKILTLFYKLNQNYVHVMVVTWTWGICLICMPEAQGPQAQGMRAFISDKSWMHMLSAATGRFCTPVLYMSMATGDSRNELLDY